ncbi:hypothetical protein [Oscillatoria sp. FACHB-1406]|uniref:hypothetical protein n=1 Tax=Oscillatoria sp. FACHB-1406 TaxID=2692846 RepID=UPI0016876F24|nr:hypothetical protein [Oscillatoria sp. FACHB-1406]MBD2579657.1 hypothetical protein [Oscillatoria sp. FACHB-1406]
MERIEDYLRSSLVFLVAIAGTLAVLFWGTLNGERDRRMQNTVQLQQKYKVIYDRIQYGASYQEIDALVLDRLRVYCDDDLPQKVKSPNRWCHWQGAPTLTLSIEFNPENRAIEKKLYYDKELGLGQK